jgi:hypothetical protein
MKCLPYRDYFFICQVTKLVFIVGAFAKKWLFWFCEALARVSGQNQMCHLCGWQKLFLKNAGRQKK